MLHLWGQAAFLKTASVGCSSASAGSAPVMQTPAGVSSQHVLLPSIAAAHLIVNYTLCFVLMIGPRMS